MLVHFIGASEEYGCSVKHRRILGFHTVTECDTVSSFAGHGKKSCWAVFLQHPELLKDEGRDGVIVEVE